MFIINKFKSTASLQIAALFILSVLFALGHLYRGQPIWEWPIFFDFKGEFPFQARVLVFAVGRLIFSTFNIGLTKENINLYYFILDTTSFFLSVLILYKTVLMTFKEKYAAYVAIALFAYMMFFTLVWNLFYLFYLPYDVPSVFFICLGLYLIEAAAALWWILLLVVIGCINRESIMIIVMVYFFKNVIHGKSICYKNIGGFVVLCLGWGLVKIMLAHLLDEPANAVVSLYHYPGVLRVVNNFDFSDGLYADQTHILRAFGGLLPILFFLKWRGNRYLAYMKTMLLYTAMLSVVGSLFEVRIFADLFPLMVLFMLGGGFHHLLRRNKQPELVEKQ